MFLTLSFVSFAGDRARGRWKGVAIGLGAVALYNLFHHGHLSPVILPHMGYERHIYYYPPVVQRPSGHWEICREWIPGHYEDGYWVKGHYEVRIFPGYYVKRKAWVEDDPYELSSTVEEIVHTSDH